MQWGSIENFFEMGGYGFYVWTSYGVCLAVIVADIVSARMRRTRALADVRREAQLAQQRAQQGRTA
jgi:heme exporter protein D